jgi:hypothetical protein
MDPTRPQFVCSQNHDEDISMSWFSVMDGTYKLVQYGTGEQVIPQLFNLSADPTESINLLIPPVSPAIAALAATLDAQLRTQIDYPAVAKDVALYQHQQFVAWTQTQVDWKKEIASPGAYINQFHWHSLYNDFLLFIFLFFLIFM